MAFQSILNKSSGDTGLIISDNFIIELIRKSQAVLKLKELLKMSRG